MPDLVETVVEDDRWQAVGLPALADRSVRTALERLGLPAAGFEVVVLGADDARIAALNAGFRGRPQPTNVLSWPSAERAAAEDGAMPAPPEPGAADDPAPLGDIALAWETCAREADAAGRPVADHVCHLVVHGTLHLLGFDHQRDGDAALMERLEAEILDRLGVADPYSQADPSGPALGTGQMNGDSEGATASPTALGAGETDPERSQPRGLIGRLFGAFAPTEQDEAEAAEGGTASGGALPAVLPGLGNLRRMRVEDVSIPAVEIVAVPMDIGREELVAKFKESGMSRLPVYQGTLDHPVGLIHLKDFALTHGFNGAGGRFSVKQMVRPLLYAPPSMPIGVLLQKMQTERIHMALVIDEYGGVDGLVTLEDLLEQVVGEIEDEHDTADPALWREEKPGVYVAQAKTPRDEFEAETSFRLVDEEDDEEVDTLGGVVFMLAGRVPARGEVIRHPSGAEFEVVDADPRRIKRLRVRLPGAASG